VAAHGDEKVGWWQSRGKIRQAKALPEGISSSSRVPCMVLAGGNEGDYDVFLIFPLRGLPLLPLQELNTPDVSKRNHRKT
jgi:hypothetical protein